MQDTELDNHNYLRNATRHAHKKAESNPIFISMLEENMPLDLYIGTLKAWRYIISTVATQTNKLIDDYSSDSVDWLNTDLAHNKHSSNPNFITPCPSIPYSHNAWGCAYVINGAQMGNRVFYKALSSSQYYDGWPKRFYAGKGKETLKHWQHFCYKLNSVALDDKKRQEAAISAASIFDFVDAVFNELASATKQPLNENIARPNLKIMA